MVYLGTTPHLKVTWRDYDKSLLTPDSQDWKVYDPSGTLKDTETDPTPESEGVYYWAYTIGKSDTPGVWKMVAEAVKTSVPEDKYGIVVLLFRVEET